ncbi:MAG: beta-N-acetylhexosaminidase [Verrucomicrobiales bacterium]|jgi:beta-N-acetylhexosaminidase
MDASSNLASLFCVGLSGHALSDEDKRMLSRGVGGIVLFSRNVDTPEQVAALIEDAREYAGTDVLACVDQEGGNTVRLEYGFTKIPSMRALGKAIAEEGSDLSLAIEVGQCFGHELREVGFDMDFAPVLDVDTNPNNPVIGERSIGNDPDQVAAIGQKFIEGLQSQGIIACGKHFPGHGDTSQDSHFDLPRLPHAMDRMETIELLPFRQVISQDGDEGGLAIMTAHVVFEAIDENLPGTLCHEVLTAQLRGSLGFRGLCVSDCMEMKAIADGKPWGGTVGASVRAIQAGVDFVTVCHTHTVMHGAVDAVEKAAQSGDLSEERIAQALARLELAREFRRSQRSREIEPFQASARFKAFVASGADEGGVDPTWEAVGGLG